MSVNLVNPPYVTFKDVDGDPLESGYIYIGNPGLNAEASPKTAYFDEAKTIVATQPIRTIGGFPVYLGSPAKVFVEGDYSIVVKDKRQQLVQSALNSAFDDENIRLTFENVAAMQAASLDIGDFVETLGYSSPGDGGQGSYEIVANGSGTNDGGSYIFLAGSGHMAKLLHNGTIHAEQFGALDGLEVSGQIQAAWDALVTWKDAQSDPENSVIKLLHSSDCTLQNQITFRRASDNTRVLGANIDFSRSALTAVSGGDLSDTNAMFLVRLRGHQRWGFLDGGKFAACYDFFGMSGSRSYNPEALHFKGFGIKVRGASGTFNMYNPKWREYDQEDSEFNTDANFTATGFAAEDGDFMVFSANGLFCGKVLELAAEAVQVHFVNAHLVNGNPNAGGTGSARVNPTLIEDLSTRENHFDNCYFDNGIIYDYGGTMNITSGHAVVNSRVSITGGPMMRILPVSVGQALPDELRINNVGGNMSVGFVDDAPNTWTGDWSSLASEYTNMAQEDRQVSYIQTQYNLYPDNIANIEYNYKPDGVFLKTWNLGADQIRETFDPANADYHLSDGSNVFFEVSSSARLLYGTGTPEGNVAAPVGSLFRRTDGGAGTTLYVKESGTGNTGWVGK